MTDPLFEPMSLTRGPAWANRLMLSPLTNCQSHADGTLSDEEYRWLTMRAQGGFGLVSTCAAHVQECGRGFPGQLGIWSDDHLPGLTRLATGLRAAGAVSAVQLHHAGLRAAGDVAGKVGPSDDAASGARALSGDAVEALIGAFVAGARRAEAAGFDGVEIHGAHGYIIASFLPPESNRRDDAWGGTPDKRAAMLRAIIDGIRATCRPDFQLGLRLSPERFGLVLPEIVALAGEVLAGGALDYLDLSLWDIAKAPEDAAYAGQSLLAQFTQLPRGQTRLGAAGKIGSAAAARGCLQAGCDFAVIGRAAIGHHDFAARARDPAYAGPSFPAAPQLLETEGVSPAFQSYLSKTFKGVVAGA